MINVEVGCGVEYRSISQVYRGLLSQYSHYFMSVLEQEYSNAGVANIELNAETDTFQLFFKWLHSGSFAPN